MHILVRPAHGRWHTRVMFNLREQRDLPTLLLIDDDLVSREVVATVLTMNGYTVHTAESGAAALKMLAAGTGLPGIILMDAQMPGLSGTRLIKKLRARSQAGVYVISGSDPPPEVVAAADGFLLKPFNPDTLHKLLEEHKTQAAASAAQEKKSKTPGKPQRRAHKPKLETTEAVVNPEILAQLREMMPAAAVREIYAAIVADLINRLTALEVAIAKGDLVEVRRIGHAIKGGCSMAGAVQAARIGATLEAAINHLDNSGPLLGDLRAAAANLQSMLEGEFPA